MSEESIDSTIRSKSFIRGLILGSIVLALSISSFYLVTAVLQSPIVVLITMYLFSMIIPLVVCVLFGFNIRQGIGGYWSFKQAVTGIFIMLFASYVILTIGRDLVFTKVIEPNMVQKTEAAMLKVSSTMYAKQGLPEGQIDAKIIERKKDFEAQKDVSASTIIEGFVITTMLLFVLAVILGAILKREPLEYRTIIPE